MIRQTNKQTNSDYNRYWANLNPIYYDGTQYVIFSRLAHALSSSNVEYLELREQFRGDGLPSTPLTQSIFNLNPAAFGLPQQIVQKVESSSVMAHFFWFWEFLLGMF